MVIPLIIRNTKGHESCEMQMSRFFQFQGKVFHSKLQGLNRLKQKRITRREKCTTSLIRKKYKHSNCLLFSSIISKTLTITLFFFRILWEFNGSKIHVFIPGKHIRLNIPYSYYGKYLTTDKRIQVTALCEVMHMHGVKLLVEKTIILEDTNIIIKVNYYLLDVLNRQKQLKSHSGAQILIWELGDKGIHLSCNFRCCCKILPA